MSEANGSSEGVYPGADRGGGVGAELAARCKNLILVKTLQAIYDLNFG